MKTTVDRKILSELRRRSGGWVSTVRLGHCSNSFAVHSSISRLRGRGFRIDSRPSQDPSKKWWYRMSR